MSMVKNIGVIVIEGHVQGLANTRALGKSGIPVYVVDVTNCVARYSKYCSKFFKCPNFVTDEFAVFLIDLAHSENLDGWVLLPSNDHAVYTISKHREELEKHYKFTIQDISVIDRIYDKWSLISLANRIGIPAPRTHITSDIVSEIDFPVITRGREGLSFYKSTGKKAFLATDRLSFQENVIKIANKIELSKTITQELIPSNGMNKTVSFTAFSVDGEIKSYWMGVKLREHPAQFGTATLTESVYEDDCLTYSRLLLKELSYTGVCEIEYLKDPRDNRFKLIEMNPRTWLWVGQAIACGVNYPVLVYNYLSGKESIYSNGYVIGVRWFNPYTYYIYCVVEAFHGNRQLLIKNTNSKDLVNALWDSSDPIPYVAYGFLLLKFYFNR